MSAVHELKKVIEKVQEDIDRFYDAKKKFLEATHAYNLNIMEYNSQRDKCMEEIVDSEQMGGKKQNNKNKNKRMRVLNSDGDGDGDGYYDDDNSDERRGNRNNAPVDSDPTKGVGYVSSTDTSQNWRERGVTGVRKKEVAESADKQQKRWSKQATALQKQMKQAEKNAEAKRRADAEAAAYANVLPPEVPYVQVTDSHAEWMKERGIEKSWADDLGDEDDYVRRPPPGYLSGGDDSDDDDESESEDSEDDDDEQLGGGNMNDMIKKYYYKHIARKN
jgi:hypothetical protein